MLEYPPILSGTAEQQIRALRDYLVRQARGTQSGEPAAWGVSGVKAVSAGRGAGAAGEGAMAQSDYDKLRALIVKTADTVEEHVEELSAELHADYLALSDFGAYQENASLEMTATARQVAESYNFVTRLTLAAELDGIVGELQQIRGEIRRGYIDLPNGGGRVFGIAIAEHLSHGTTTVTRDGLEYVELDTGQSMGFYTATGWQFWLNGTKVGWFDSADGMLHVGNMMAENSLRIGQDWLITGTGGFGLRYVGV